MSSPQADTRLATTTVRSYAAASEGALALPRLTHYRDLELENLANGQLSGILWIVSTRVVNQILTKLNIGLTNGSVSDDVKSAG